MSRGGRAILRRFRRSTNTDGHQTLGPVALAQAQATAAQVDIVDQAQAFKTLRVSEVMTPRADIMAVEISSPFEAVVRLFAEVEHSRMPVYRETLDDPVGVIHIKDVFKLLATGATVEDINNSLTANNVNLPGGRMDDPTKETTVSIHADIQQPQDILGIPLSVTGGALKGLTIGNVARSAGGAA